MTFALSSLMHKIARCPEKDFQSRINSIFKYYLRWGNNIVSEESIHIGSAQSIRPDFVLYENGVAQVVIEAKRPVHSPNRKKPGTTVLVYATKESRFWLVYR